MRRFLLGLVIVTTLARGTVIETGFAPRYSPGLMRKVAVRRGLTPEAHMVSRPEGPIGGHVTVCGVKTGQCFTALIVDVSQKRDLARHLRTRRIVEVSFEDAPALCGGTRGRPEDCPVWIVEP